MTNESSALNKTRVRIDSIDAFRGITIFLMVFVIAVAAGNYPNLPQERSWFGSLPVSAWNHAEVGWERFVEEMREAGLSENEIKLLPEAKLKNVGLTATDLVAPFFIFIVGLVIPLSRSRRGREWWNHVASRTLKLIIAGVLYISLILGLSWWWGILQAIGIAYFMGAASMRLPRRMKWITVFGVLALHLVMTEFVGWWLQFGNIAEPFWRISDPLGNMAKPLIIHCLPWVSISYGAMTMIGVLLGEAIVTGKRKAITQRSMLIGVVFMGLGYAIHKTGLIIGHTSLCFNKPDVSASYAMFTSGLGAMVFLALYYIMDIWGKKKWAYPFAEFGRNALLAYFMQVIMRIFFRGLHLEYFFAGKPNEALLKWADVLNSPFWTAFLLDKSGYNGMVWGLIWTVCLWGIIMYFNKKSIYWKL